MRVVFAAGGTAGHINPALAIADKVMNVFPDSEVMFIGTPEGMESKLTVKAGYKFTPLKTAGIQRRVSIKNVARNMKAIYYYVMAQPQAKRILEDFAPDYVIGTGGYVCAPVLLAAAKMGLKTATHESNVYPGMTTKLLSKKVDKVFISVEESKKYFEHKDNLVVTGNPLRNNIIPASKEEARKQLGLKDGMTILSFGGSLGANKISEAVVQLLAWEKVKGDVNHIHAYGGSGKDMFNSLMREQGVSETPGRTIISEYLYNMYTCMAAADLVICRSGAMTLTELMAIGRASILIPFPAAAENHQYYNALRLQDNNAGIMIEDKNLDKYKLIECVERFYNGELNYNEMGENAKKMASANAADIILSEILDIRRTV